MGPAARPVVTGSQFLWSCRDGDDLLVAANESSGRAALPVPLEPLRALWLGEYRKGRGGASATP